MDYDFRNKAGPPYRQNQNNNAAAAATSTPSTRPMYGNPSMYPKVGQPTATPIAARNPSFHPSSSPPSGSAAALGIRVYLKPEYRLTPLPPLLPLRGEIPRSSFQFDFELENRVLAEAEKEKPNWSKLGLEYASSRRTVPTPSLGSSPDPIVSKYIASGLNREAVPIAVANYGDNPENVRRFVNGFNQLREMGFSPNNVAEALLKYDNDTEKALAYFLNNSA